jgi:Mg2+ and Co2+ transporter CorA
LAESERHARELTHYERGDEVELPALREKAFDAAERTDDQAEIAKQLDDKISQILRRLGGRDSDIPRTAEALAPPEVERRYRLARDEVRALHDDCRLTSQIVRQALSDYEQKQRERFQFLAALLASIVLIPTLIASIFGASVDVPAEHSDFGFPALLAVIAGLAVTSCYALWTAQRHHWIAGKNQFALPVIVAIAIVVAYAVFLVQS